MLENTWQQVATTSWIEWLGTLTGIIGVYFSIKEKISAWYLFLVCYAVYIYLSYHAGLYAAVAMNAAFIVISFYGWLNWSRAFTKGITSINISKTPKNGRIAALAFIFFGTIGFGGALYYFTSAYMPYLDAFALCNAFTAQWMLSRKYVENWLFWILADIIYLGLWWAQGYLISAILFTIFISLAIRGWLEWRRQMKAHNQYS
ncbi:MAG: nicotinamide riboside transporter PnuC [Verrucomicrobiota bacterium]|nr:nicotinamide riboside transporter PnuC [Verrucomicrobiota bacterium]